MFDDPSTLRESAEELSTDVVHCSHKRFHIHMFHPFVMAL